MPRNHPISSAGAESVVDYVIGQRMKRNGHMRWRQGEANANALLQVRCAVLNGQGIRNFKRWYPPGRRLEGSVCRQSLRRLSPLVLATPRMIKEPGSHRAELCIPALERREVCVEHLCDSALVEMLRAIRIAR
jgi:hypothetical protein